MKNSFFVFPTRQTRGNALFLILIGICLFATLMYAITQSSKNGGGSATKEQAQLLAAQITQMSSDVAYGIQRMQLMGTDITTGALVVGNAWGVGNNYPGYGHLNSPTADDFCTTGANCLFAPDGGGVAPPKMPQAAFTGNGGISAWFVPGGMYGAMIDSMRAGMGPDPHRLVQGVGTAATDIMLVAAPLRQDVCQAINTGLGINGIPTQPSLPFNGTITATPGYYSACIGVADVGSYGYFYQVLYAR